MSYPLSSDILDPATYEIAPEATKITCGLCPVKLRLNASYSDPSVLFIILNLHREDCLTRITLPIGYDCLYDFHGVSALGYT
jgi:hypothetical protein